MSPRSTDPDTGTDADGGTPVARDSIRARVRRRPGLRQVWRAGVFVVGLLCIATGFALVVLPGPLTIPPVVLGLWVWSTEFPWANRLLAAGTVKGQAAWEQAKRRPVSSTVLTVGGLVMAATVIWATVHFEVVDRGKQLVGLA